jgi:hypothetical protein
VLGLLRQHKLYAKLSKCDFNKPEVPFLGHIIGYRGIAVDPKKVAVVRDWPVPTNISELRAFLGLCNFFRRFVKGFSQIAAPLTALTGKDAAERYKWDDWAKEERAAFNKLKEALCSAPVLALPDFDVPFEVWTDASLEGTGGVLIQADRPVAYTSAKLSSAERNYTTTEQELLGIVRALQVWRCYLEGAKHQVTVVTDHNPLTYLHNSGVLSRRLARWVQFLSRFHMEIVYRPGSGNVADPVSRNPGLADSEDGDDMGEVVGELAVVSAGLVLALRGLSLSEQSPQQQQQQAVGPASGSIAALSLSRRPPSISSSEPAPDRVRRCLAALERRRSARLEVNRRRHEEAEQRRAERAARYEREQLERLGYAINPGPAPARKSTRGRVSGSSGGEAQRAADADAVQQGAQAVQPVHDPPAPGTADADPDMQLTLHEELQRSYAADPDWRPAPSWRREHGLWLNPAGLIVVPNSRLVRTRVIAENHDAVFAGHVGITKTLEKVRRRYWWRSMAADVTQYVRTCDACQRNKASMLLKAGKLQSLQMPEGRWESVGMDLIVKLPKTDTVPSYDSILVFIDRLTKMVHLVPTTEALDARGFADLFVQHVFSKHGMPKEVVSDRGPQFNNQFWEELCKRLGMDRRMSSAYHPQSNGQTERVNRVIEEMMRSYISPSQREWNELLPLVEFAINNSWQEAVQSTPFFLNYGYHPLTPADAGLPVRVPGAAKYVRDLEQIVKDARRKWAEAQERMKQRASDHRREVSYEPGQLVMLSTANIRWGSDSEGVRKLKPRYMGPFEVIEMRGPVSVKLKLPQDWRRMHNVFHVSLVKPYLSRDGEARKHLVAPPPLQWLDGEPIYEVHSLVGHREWGKGKRKQLQFLVRWEGYTPEHDTWEPRKNLLTCNELIRAYKAVHGMPLHPEDMATD